MTVGEVVGDLDSVADAESLISGVVLADLLGPDDVVDKETVSDEDDSSVNDAVTEDDDEKEAVDDADADMESVTSSDDEVEVLTSNDGDGLGLTEALNEISAVDDAEGVTDLVNENTSDDESD